MYEAIILAGGFGTRLREAVPDLPKPMAPVADKPFLAWQLDHLIKCGVTRFILSVGYKAQTIRDYFGDEYRGAAIVYVEETEPLGTGGAIQYALTKTTHKRVFVFNGDTLCEADISQLRELNINNPNGVGIVVKQVDNAGRYGAITINKADGLVSAFGEKSSSASGFINAGIYDIPNTLFAGLNLKAPFAFEKEVIETLVLKNLYGYEAGEFFIDIGIPDDFTKAQYLIPKFIDSYCQV